MVEKKSFCIVFLAAILTLALVSSAHCASPLTPSDARLVLPAVWQIQPATEPSAAPAGNEWGQISSISGDWRSWKPVGTSPSWAGVDRSKVNSLWYQQSVAIPADWQGHRVIADFRRIEGDAIVFVNGQRVSELLRPGGEIDLTSEIHIGAANEIQVFITRSYTGISRGFKDDPLRYTARAGQDDPLLMSEWPLGITAPVTLIARATPVGISDIFMRPSWRTKSLSIDVTTDASKAVSGVVIAADIIDETGKTVLTLRTTLFDAPAGQTVHTATALWANPIPWELDGPYLYTARVRLEHNGATADSYPDTQFGFREIWTDGRQIMMNGHPSRWRMSSLMEGGERDPAALSFFKLLGYDVFVFQDNPNTWWRDRQETPIWDEATLDEMDREGLGVSMPAPSVNWIKTELLSDPAAVAEYKRSMTLYLQRYRNHPCILAWTVGMNAYNPSDAISPQGMGRRETKPAPMATVIDKAAQIAKSIDPTRLVYSHADGGEADISSSNTYLNFAPLQEREDWPSEWASTGNMPAMAAEFGQPFTANFWKGKRSFFTEYTAIYLGDHAYQEETEGALHNVIAASIANKRGFGDTNKIDFSNYPNYWDFQSLFVRNTNRAWRTWGVDGGWSYWTLDTGYGDPPGFAKGTNVFSRYTHITQPVTQKPSWANPNFDIHRQANQPLLAYIAGNPNPTDKTHAFFAGETVTKNIAFVWDGPSTKKLAVSWSVTGGKALTPQSFSVTLAPGDIKLISIKFEASATSVRMTGSITMNARDAGAIVASDTLPIQIFPQRKLLQTAAHIALYDPKGLSGPTLAALGIHAAPWKPGESLQDINLLVIGREALQAGQPPLYTPQDIARGLRVLVLEQQPAIWQGLGFQTIDVMPRYVFKRAQDSLILDNVQSADLINWRGSPNLLPADVTLPHDDLHAPKWTNRGAVASVALQIPEVVGFTPILACEFDLNYSPLLQCRYGAGQITFCTLDLTGRVGVDPDATLIARNLFAEETAKPSESFGRSSVVGDAAPANSDLLLPDNAPNYGEPHGGVIVAGSGIDRATHAQLEKFVEGGGTVVDIPQSDADLKALGAAIAPISIYRASGDLDPLMNAVGPNLLRWRDHLDFDGFTDAGHPSGSKIHAGGLVMTRQDGKGEWVFCQAQPELLATRYVSDPDKQEAIQTSVQHLYQLESQILTNAGVDAETAVIRRLSHLSLGPAYQTFGECQELGPFPFTQDDGDAMLDMKFPGEDSAIAGDTNPNITYKCSDGTALNWRQTVTSDASGHIDLGSQLGQSGLAVAYLVKHIHSDHAREAILRLGVDYRIAVWVNGKMVFRTIKGRAHPASFLVNIPLNAGDNVITMKIGSGSKGFGVWADLAQETAPSEATTDSAPKVSLYHPLTPSFDPYEFHYW